MLPAWVQIILTASVGFISAVVLGYLTGQWGGLRRAERIADLLGKVKDPYLASRLRERLKLDLDRELRNLDRRMTPTARIAAGIVYSIFVLMFLLGGITRGRSAKGFLEDTGVINALAKQSAYFAETFRPYDLSGERILLAQAVLDTVFLIFLGCLFYLIIWAFRSLSQRSWGPGEEPAPARVSASEVFDALFVTAQVLFVLTALLPALIGVVIAL